MVSAVLKNSDRQSQPITAERGSGRIVSLSRTPYAIFQQGQVVFNHDGNKGSGCYCCTFHKHSGARSLIGAIEFNKRTGCWQITHVARQPWFDGIPFLSHTEATDRLIELHQLRAAA